MTPLKTIASLAAFALASGASARADTTSELDLRSYSYTFNAPGSNLGPWHAIKADYVANFTDDTLIVRAVTGNHDDRPIGAHGEFLRLEDYHRFDPRVEVKFAAGAGSGYQPLRTATAEAAFGIDPGRRVALTFGEVLTSPTNATFQRIFAYGTDLRFGAVNAYARLYEAVEHVPDRTGPSTLALDAATPVARGLLVAVHGNFGGEVGGDRTASQLPTSSGRVGPDVALSVRYALTSLAGVSATYEEAAYRSAAGAFAYRDHVAIVGLYTRFGTRRHAP